MSASTEFPPLPIEQVRGMTDPKLNGPWLVAMSFEVLAWRTLAKRMGFTDFSDFECNHGVSYARDCADCNAPAVEFAALGTLEGE